MQYACRFVLFSTLKRFGIQPESLPQLPIFDFPVREYVEGEDQIPKQDIYSMTEYKKKQFPRCRYMAFERKGKIYHIFDASRYPLGRMCGQIATQIRGKNTPLYRNNIINEGSTCIIVNASDPLLTGKKLLFKTFRYHTGFIGHLRQIPYTEIIRRKPQLLYHFVIRKFMPKNTLSEKYMKNVHIFRGPTHGFKFLPQFAPDLNIYEALPEIDMKEVIKNSPDARVIMQSEPGLDKQVFGREIPFESPPPPPTTRSRPTISKQKIKALYSRYKQLLNRYKRVGIKTRVRTKDEDLIYIDDQRKAKKMPNYAELADEDAEEEDEQILKEVFLSEEAEKKDDLEEAAAQAAQIAAAAKQQSKPVSKVASGTSSPPSKPKQTVQKKQQQKNDKKKK